jgi:hypothetical protein
MWKSSEVFAIQIPFFHSILTYKIKSPTSAMEAAIAALEMLQLLPDPDQELSIQQLSEFTLFPKLPIEIRLMIWRFTFRKAVSHYIQRHTDDSWLKFPADSPISSSVNRESRQETLRYYHVLEEAEAYGDQRFRTFWNKEDSIVGNFYDLICETPIYDRNFVDFAAAIGSVKIQFSYICDNCCDARVFGHHDKALGYYMNLSELHIIDRFDELQNMFGINRDECIQKLRNVFEEIVAKDIKGSNFSVPRITVSRSSWPVDELQD